VSKLSELNWRSHFLFVAVIQNLEHFVSVMVIDFNSAEVYILGGKLLNLFFNDSSFRVTLWIVIVAITMILFAVSWSISYKNSVSALSLPVLINSILKTTSNILGTISSSHCI